MREPGCNGSSRRHDRKTGPASRNRSQCGTGWSWVTMANRGIGKPGQATMAKADKGGDSVTVVTRNRRASHDYELSDRLECGVVLVGTEVKSLRDGHCSLDGSYAKIDGGELWLVGCEIPEYAMGNRLNHKPKRDRKL